MRWKQVISGAVFSVVALIGASAIQMHRLRSDHCAAVVFDSAHSPNRNLQAVVYSSDCGADSGVTRQVVLIDGNIPIAETKHLPRGFFAVAMDQSTEPRLLAQDPLIRLQWRSDDRLDIAYSPATRPFRSAERVRGVGIQYLESLNTQENKTP